MIRSTQVVTRQACGQWTASAVHFFQSEMGRRRSTTGAKRLDRHEFTRPELHSSNFRENFPKLNYTRGDGNFKYDAADAAVALSAPGMK